MRAWYRPTRPLIAQDGATLHQAAEDNRVDLYYEAAVAGAIPLLRPLRESLVGDRVQRVLGIVNGTTNFMLTKMDEEGADYAECWRRHRNWDTQRRTRPPTWRGSTRRQGRDPGGTGLPQPGQHGGRVLRGHVQR